MQIILATIGETIYQVATLRRLFIQDLYRANTPVFRL